MKFALMAEHNQIGNDEPWNRIVGQITGAVRGAVKKQEKMTIPARPIAYFADFRPMRALCWIFAAAILAAVAAPGTADAARRAGIVRAGAYDGVWNVAFATTAGNCSSTNSVPFMVSGHRVSSAGRGKVTGGIGRGGSVSVAISVGASRASGRGRLVGNSGAGRWSGIISGDRCSGIWQATRN
jgi:hypothetical protein